MDFKFAHMADLHLGGWRDPELEAMNLEAFDDAIDNCIQQGVAFVVLSGDLFDTSMPSFDILDKTTKNLNRLKRAGIPVYALAGSHDFSPSGKSMLKVLENAELLEIVSKAEDKDGKILLRFTEDKKTGAKLTGIFGRKGSLDETYYRQLDRSIENEPGFKIFLFHSGIQEYRPDYLKDVQAMPLSLLPGGFAYYAGGHIHHRSESEYEGGKVIFPGPLFPCNFQELERFGSGGFYIVDVLDGIPKPSFVDLKRYDINTIKIDADGKSASQVETELLEALGSKAEGLEDSVVLVRVSGILSEGKPSDIAFHRIADEARERGARALRKNTAALSSREYQEIMIKADSIEELEHSVIKENLGQSGLEPDAEKTLVEKFMALLDAEKLEGETVATYESRINGEGYKILKT